MDEKVRLAEAYTTFFQEEGRDAIDVRLFCLMWEMVDVIHLVAELCEDFLFDVVERVMVACDEYMVDEEGYAACEDIKQKFEYLKAHENTIRYPRNAREYLHNWALSMVDAVVDNRRPPSDMVVDYGYFIICFQSLLGVESLDSISVAEVESAMSSPEMTIAHNRILTNMRDEAIHHLITFHEEDDDA